MMQSAYVLTDSGGLIREAHHLQRHVLVRRDYGGWDELVTLGVNRRIGDDANDIRAAMSWAEEVRQRPYPTESPLVRSNGVQFGIEALLALGGGPI